MGSFPEALRLYIFCKSMNWTHLPVGGGLYDQHPDLLDKWEVIQAEDAKAEKRRAAESERKSKGSSGGAAPRRGGGKRRRR